MRRFLAWMLIVITIAALGLTACYGKGATPCTQQEWPALRIAFGRGPTQVPLRDTFPSEVLTETALVLVDTPGRVKPGMAESWETTDRQTWAFTLRADLRAHNGERLTADRIRADILAQVATPEFSNPVWRDLQAIDTPTPRRLVFRFAHPVSFVPEALLFLTIVSKERPDFSSGPFRLTRDTGDEMDFEAVARPADGTPRLTKVKVVRYPSTRAAWAAFLRNETDVLYEVPSSTLPVLSQNPDIRLYGSPMTRVATLTFNLRQRWLRDVRVRQAINLAIDRDDVERRMYGGLSPTVRRLKPLVGPFSPDFWATEGLPSRWHYDLPAALALLKEATGGRTQPIEIVCLTTSEYPDIAEMTAILEAQLRRAHIRLRLQPVPWKEFLSRARQEDGEAWVVPVQTGAGSLYQYQNYHSGGIGAGFYRNAAYAGADAALDRLYRATSPDAERAAVRAAVDAMYHDPPAAFLMPMQYIRAVRKTWRVPDDEIDIRRSLSRWRFDAPCGGS